MHYGDFKQLEHNKLVLIVYKHGTSKPNKFEYEISSISECKLFPPYLIAKILNKPNKFFKNRNELVIVEEQFNLIEIQDTNSMISGCKLISICVVPYDITLKIH